MHQSRLRKRGTFRKHLLSLKRQGLVTYMVQSRKLKAGTGTEFASLVQAIETLISSYSSYSPDFLLRGYIQEQTKISD